MGMILMPAADVTGWPTVTVVGTGTDTVAVTVTVTVFSLPSPVLVCAGAVDAGRVMDWVTFTVVGACCAG